MLKGVVRVERLDDATPYVAPLLGRVKKEYLVRAYKVKKWADVEDFLAQLAALSGKLLKGGDPDLNTAAKMVLQDWQRGKLPYYSLPPGVEPNAAHYLAKQQQADEEADEEDGAAAEDLEDAEEEDGDEEDEEGGLMRAIMAAGEAKLRQATARHRKLAHAIPTAPGLFDAADNPGGLEGAGHSSDEAEDEAEDDGSDEEDDGAENLDRFGSDEEGAAGGEGAAAGSDSESEDPTGYGKDGLRWDAVMAAMQQRQARKKGARPSR